MLLLLKRLLENPVKRDSPEGGIIMSSTELFAVKILREVLNYDIIFPDEVFPFLDSSLYSKYLELPHRDFFPFINGAICGNFALIPTSPSPISLFDHCSIGNNALTSPFFPWEDASDENEKWKYYGERFVCEDKTSPSWLIMSKGIIPGSDTENYNWDNRCYFQGAVKNARLPNIAELVWFILAYRLITGKRILVSSFCKTSSFCNDGFRVVAGVSVKSDLEEIIISTEQAIGSQCFAGIAPVLLLE